MRAGRAARPHLRDLLDHDLAGAHIHVADHCYGCTAGQGSSCGGALEAAAPASAAQVQAQRAGRGALMARPSKALLWAGAAGLALVAAWAWRHYELGALLTLDNLKASRDALQARVQAAAAGHGRRCSSPSTWRRRPCPSPAR
jgi:hypothetical protein